MEKCPKICICGAPQKQDDGGKTWKVYECETFCHQGKIHTRSEKCYKRQLNQLIELLNFLQDWRLTATIVHSEKPWPFKKIEDLLK